MNERKNTRNLFNSLIGLFLTAAIVLPIALYFTALNTPPEAAHLKVAIQATSVSGDETAVTAAPTPSDAIKGDGSQPEEIVITVKSAEMEEPKEESETIHEWTAIWEDGPAAWGDGTAILTLVVVNEGDVPVQPCLVIPAVYDHKAVPVNVYGVEVLTGAGAKPSGTKDPDLQGELDNICQTGIGGMPDAHYDYSTVGRVIPPGRSTIYTIVLHLVKGGGLPHKGQVNVYIPQASPNEDEKLPKLTPYQTLPFTIQSSPYSTFGEAWQSLRSWGLPVLTGLLELFAVLLVAVLLLGFGLPRIKQQLGNPSLELDVIKTKDTDEKSGDGERLRSLLEDEIDRFRSPSIDRAFSPNLVTGSTGATKFELPSKLNEQAIFGVIATILEYIFRPNTLRVTGQMQSSSVRGLGVTLKLTDNRSGEIFATESFWEVDYSGLKRLSPSTTEKPFDPLPLLVQAAAAWVCCKASDFVGESYKPMGTTSWQSTAYSVCALYMFGLITQKNAPADARARALDLFHTALSYDSNNPVAGINYARLTSESLMEQKRTNKEQYQTYTLTSDRFKKVLSTLESVISDRKEVSQSKILDEELWFYQAQYNLATVASLQANTDKGKAKVKRRFAVKTLRDLARRLAEKAEALPSYQPAAGDGTNEKKPSYLNRIHAREGKLRDERYSFVLRSMRQAIIVLIGLMAMDAKKKPDPDFAECVAGTMGSQADINYRVHYDIACYFSLGAKNPQVQGTRQQECYRNGFFHLEQALELPGDLQNLARVDDDLENLNKHDPNRFNQIVSRYTETKTTSTTEPAQLTTVLRILREQADVATPEALLVAGRTPANRRNLSKKSDGKLSYKVITKWVHIADLMQLPGVDEIYATLLYKMGVISPQELKSRNPELLLKAMVEFNKKHNIKKRLPSQESISHWIRSAANTPDRVQ